VTPVGHGSKEKSTSGSWDGVSRVGRGWWVGGQGTRSDEEEREGGREEKGSPARCRILATRGDIFKFLFVCQSGCYGPRSWGMQSLLPPPPQLWSLCVTSVH
jgi:hypothetical protein